MNMFKAVYYTLTLQWKKLYHYSALEGHFDPHEKLQNHINEETAKIIKGRRSLNESGAFIRKLQRQVDTHKTDISRLSARVQMAVDEQDNDKAKGLIKRLQDKEDQLETTESNLNIAKSSHQMILETIEQHQRTIRETQQEAQQLKISLNLAEANKESAAFNLEMTRGLGSSEIGAAKDEIKDQIRQAQAQASLDTSLTNSPEDEFMEDSVKANIENRLAKFKRK